MYEDVKLAGMSLVELRALRDKISAAIRRAKSKRKVPVKYRNPSNPQEAWAGRGLRPKWAKNLSDAALERCRVAQA